MTFSYGQREVTVDSRTSDAVAIALRMNAPYTRLARLSIKPAP